MRILDRYICREVFSHALLGLAVFTFVFFVPQLVRLMELVVRHAAAPGRVALLFLCTFPSVLTFTLPIAVLIGVLIGLGRMSADSELIALHAVGISLRRILLPVGVLALGTAGLTLALTLWLGPLAVRTLRVLEDRLRASQASLQVQPRVFDERFPRLVLYVQDVEAAGTRWRGVFLAESSTGSESRLTLAEEAIVIADREQGKVQFHLRNGSSHAYSPRNPNEYSVSTFGNQDWPIEVGAASTLRAAQVSDQERSLRELLARQGPNWREARVEFHRRLAFPAACLVFALLGVPLGARPRRGGRAAGFLVTLLLICGYYLVFIAGAGLARQGIVEPVTGMWAANVVSALFGLVLLPHMEQVRGEGWLARLAEAVARWRRKPQPAFEAVPAARPNGPPRATRSNPAPSRRWGSFPQLLDLYLLRHFFYYFFLLLAGFVLLIEAFTFFELLDDITRHRTPFLVVVSYFRYYAPQLIYQLAPLAALVAVLITLGVMTKNNEIVAFKAAGVSLYRLAWPLLGAGLALATGMLALDDSYLPYANRRQDALRNQIKGRPAQTFFQPRHQWIFGEKSKVYNYDVFDPDRKLFGGLNVFELDPATFQLRRRVYASRAHWDDHRNTWVLEFGWVRDFEGAQVVQFVSFRGQYSLAELSEPPGYFNREVLQYYQMNWRELRQYIEELQRAGFDVAKLSVQFHRKLAFPLLALIIVLLGIPFAFLVGTRGAVGGLALGVGIAIVYWFTAALFEAMGTLGQLPPVLAGWGPDAIFGFFGLYFFLKMPT